MANKNAGELKAVDITIGLVLISLTTYSIDRWVVSFTKTILGVDQAHHWGNLAIAVIFVAGLIALLDLVPDSRTGQQDDSGGGG